MVAETHPRHHLVLKQAHRPQAQVVHLVVPALLVVVLLAVHLNTSILLAKNGLMMKRITGMPRHANTPV